MPAPSDEPDPTRLPIDHPHRKLILARHAAAVSTGEAGYLDPGSGLFVLTSAYLEARGKCCDQRCRHCPFIARGDCPGETS